MNRPAGLPLFDRLAPAETLLPGELERLRNELIGRLQTLKPRSREHIIMEARLAEITLCLLRS